MQKHGTGDLHYAAYDFAGGEMLLAVGRVDGAGNYGADGQAWQAHNRPALVFDLEELWGSEKTN